MDGLRVARNLLHAALFVGVLIGLMAPPPQARRAVACKPIITLKSVQISEPLGMKRRWTAILDVNASFCATSFGRFGMDFIREKENAPDMQFTEQFEWRPGTTRSRSNSGRTKRSLPIASVLSRPVLAASGSFDQR